MNLAKRKNSPQYMFCHPDGELNILNINFLHIQFTLDESSSLVSLTGESLELEDWKPPCEGVARPLSLRVISHLPSICFEIHPRSHKWTLYGLTFKHFPRVYRLKGWSLSCGAPGKWWKSWRGEPGRRKLSHRKCACGQDSGTPSCSPGLPCFCVSGI